MTLNPFSSLPPPDSGSEQIVQAKPVALDEAVEKAYRVYEGLDIFYDSSLMSRLEKQILNPSQIDSLLQMIISEAEPEKFNSITGLYLSRLIQDSYDAGHNNFVLTTGDTHITEIGRGLSGSKEKLLKIRINGNIGFWCFEYVNFSKITIYGNVYDDCGFNANSSEIAIYGNAGDRCWQVANSSEIALYGNAGDYFGLSAINTIFIAHNEQAYHMFKRDVEKCEGNTIQLVDSSGKLIKEEHL